jgi:hypothetical protein
MEGCLRATAASPRPRVGRVASDALSNRHALGSRGVRRGRVAYSRESDARRVQPNARRAGAESTSNGGDQLAHSPALCECLNCARSRQPFAARSASKTVPIEPERGIRVRLTLATPLTRASSAREVRTLVLGLDSRRRRHLQERAGERGRRVEILSSSARSSGFGHYARDLTWSVGGSSRGLGVVTCLLAWTRRGRGTEAGGQQQRPTKRRRGRERRGAPRTGTLSGARTRPCLCARCRKPTHPALRCWCRWPALRPCGLRASYPSTSASRRYCTRRHTARPPSPCRW